MGEEKILDVAHVGILSMFGINIHSTGASATQGSPIENAIEPSEKFEKQDFATLEDFIDAIDTVNNPISQIEGKAIHKGDGIFGLQKCPFVTSIANFKNVFGELPDSYKDYPLEKNKKSPFADRHKVDHGAEVTAFCAIHQPLRSAISTKVTIGGKPILVYQLGCKSGGGQKGFAEKFIKDNGISKEKIDKILDTYMCCYGIKVQD